MAATPQLSTIITWLLYFVPVYIFVLDPLIRPYFPENASLASWGDNQDGHSLEEWDNSPSTLHLTDDSFISPDDGAPVNCPGEAEGYRVHLLSRAPLVLYIENFVSAAEADHLVDIRYIPLRPTDFVRKQSPKKTKKQEKKTNASILSTPQSKQIHPLNNLRRQNPTYRSHKTPLRPRPPRPRRHSPLPREPRPRLPRLASTPLHRAHVGTTL
jgi:hypothetical protein